MGLMLDLPRVPHPPAGNGHGRCRNGRAFLKFNLSSSRDDIVVLEKLDAVHDAVLALHGRHDLVITVAPHVADRLRPRAVGPYWPLARHAILERVEQRRRPVYLAGFVRLARPLPR